jgi:hypothetical protein
MGVARPEENPNNIHPLHADPADWLLNKVIDGLQIYLSRK